MFGFVAKHRGIWPVHGTIDFATSMRVEGGLGPGASITRSQVGTGRTYKGSPTELRDRDWKVGVDTAVYYDGADPTHNALEISQLPLTAVSQQGRAVLSGVCIVDRHLSNCHLLASVQP